MLIFSKMCWSSLRCADGMGYVSFQEGRKTPWFIKPPPPRMNKKRYKIIAKLPNTTISAFEKISGPWKTRETNICLTSKRSYHPWSTSQKYLIFPNGTQLSWTFKQSSFHGPCESTPKRRSHQPPTTELHDLKTRPLARRGFWGFWGSEQLLIS